MEILRPWWYRSFVNVPEIQFFDKQLLTHGYKEYNWDYLNKKAYNNTIGKYRTEIELKFPLAVFFCNVGKKTWLV